jgi:hypothetical protein
MSVAGLRTTSPHSLIISVDNDPGIGYYQKANFFECFSAFIIVISAEFALFA